jgi:hypothetical protein
MAHHNCTLRFIAWLAYMVQQTESDDCFQPLSALCSRKVFCALLYKYICHATARGAGIWQQVGAKPKEPIRLAKT